MRSKMSYLHILLLTHLTIIFVISLFFSSNGLTLRMIPITSPHLQIIPETYNNVERFQFLANISMSRIYNRRNFSAPDGIKSPIIKGVHFFFTQLAMSKGNTAYKPYLILDTGSSITWIQCDGCNPCFDVEGGNFAYAESTSFMRVSLQDDLCPSDHVNIDGSCGISISYGNPPHATVTGLLGREDFSFKNSRTNNVEVYQGLAFLCATSNQGFEFGHENQIAGIFGVSLSSLSFLFQLKAQTNLRFSYCLPPLIQLISTECNMYFGDDAVISGDATRQVQSISMLATNSHYYLSVSGISVNGIRLPIDPAIFQYDEHDNRKGFIIDIGAPNSVLARSAYDHLKAAIVKYLRDAYGWLPRPPGQFMDLCYSIYPGYEQLSYPVVVLHFVSPDQSGEVDMVLTKDQLFVDVSLVSGVDHGLCLMVAPTDDPGPTLLGAFQQSNIAFLHDLPSDRLYFVPQQCAS
ncbi:hypothetical protein RND81_04G190400 [Saponaria officinalis]|uniref:Peptidase A1 domain-containing protein n=1 Tax=Saponaria officinalis TaxID=3572 RepID=A0AAW1LQS0_SAPOF